MKELKENKKNYETMKVFVLFEKDINTEAEEDEDNVTIIGVYNTIEKARFARQILIDDDIENYDFVQDEEAKYEDKTIKLFYEYQENYCTYLELTIVEKDMSLYIK